MEQYKELNAHRDGKAGTAVKKDKCGEQKRVQREVKQALKQQRAGTIEQRREEQEAMKQVIKDERVFNGPTSRRAREDLRNLEKRAHKLEDADTFLCEHGINKCRICFPPNKLKPQHHKSVAVDEYA